METVVILWQGTYDSPWNNAFQACSQRVGAELEANLCKNACYLLLPSPQHAVQSKCLIYLVVSFAGGSMSNILAALLLRDGDLCLSDAGAGKGRSQH